MTKAYIDGKLFEFQEDITILEAARKGGIFIPTLCEFRPLGSVPGTCSVCLVEIERKNGEKFITTSCKTKLEEDMKVNTSSPSVRARQRQQIELIFADHEQDCVACPRYGHCELLSLAKRLGVRVSPFTGKYTAPRRIDNSDIALRLDANKCIRCYRCVEVCRKIQGCDALTISEIGNHSGVALQGVENWADSSRCVRCGQCTLVCPTGALSAKDQVDQALELFENPEYIKVVQFAPSVRATLGESVGLPPGMNVEGKVVTALKKLGADIVLDTNFSADVTIMEEGTELLGRLRAEAYMPMFTSCCPGWVNWVEQHKPELINHLSTTRSPQGIMSSLAKSWLPEKINVNPEKIKVISIMPCTAKKIEANRPQLSDGANHDTDLVLTVREFSRLLQGRGIELDEMEESVPDNPFMSRGSGAGMIFGRTAGVAEAAIRTLHFVAHNTELEGEVQWKDSDHPGVHKETEVDLGDLGKIRVAAVYGLANARKVADEALEGKSPYKFIEIMACPGGCVNGGGTVRDTGKYFAKNLVRASVLNDADKGLPLRQSHNNPMVTQLYEEFLGKPNSQKAHHLLHTEFTNRKPETETPDIREIWERLRLG